MKKTIMLGLLLSGLFLNKALAQVSVHVRVGGPYRPVAVVRPVVVRPVPRPVVVVRPAPVVAVVRPVRVVRIYH